MKKEQAFEGRWYRSTNVEICCDCGLAHRMEWKMTMKGKKLNDLIKKYGGEIKLLKRVWRENHKGGDRREIHHFTES